jgi:hypothetical protein
VGSRDTRGSTGVAGIRRRMGQEVRGGHMPEAEEVGGRKGSVGVAVKLQGIDLGLTHTTSCTGSSCYRGGGGRGGGGHKSPQLFTSTVGSTVLGQK